MRHYPTRQLTRRPLLILAVMYISDGIFTLTGLRCIRNDKAVPGEHDWYREFSSCSEFFKKHMGEPVGFGPMLRSRNDCINLLLMLKIV